MSKPRAWAINRSVCSVGAQLADHADGRQAGCAHGCRVPSFWSCWIWLLICSSVRIAVVCSARFVG
jgi:hypothetical protein